MGVERLTIEISGAVQGVGFRPFVYRLATELALTGWVVNDARGVVIDVEGERAPLTQFLHRLSSERPPHSVVHAQRTAWRAPTGYDRFEIRASDAGAAKSVAVLPDLATCPDCLAEVLDPANRRYGYPFTNCTRCGPRFSIVRALPYDRPNTTMRRFTLCPACAHEYRDPLDRRFHAQPNACPDCGPRLALWVRDDGGVFREAAIAGDALALAAAGVCHGEIAAVKGLGGFHLMVDAGDAEAVRRLRERKRRPDKPFALMVEKFLDAVRRLCECSPECARQLLSPEAPILLLRKRGGETADGRPAVVEAVAPENPTLGVMLPATPLHHLLMRAVGRPVVATSGNLGDEPICIDERDAVRRLGGIADVFLVHDRPIARHIDDSVVHVVAGAPRLLRRARGWAPLPVRLKAAVPPVLAVGAHLKNTIALAVGDQVFVSQHIGDLETPEAMAAFHRVIDDFLRLYETEPAAIAYDMHPDYRSSRWAHTAVARYGADDGAGEGRCRGVAVQHHHAHLASCLAENRVEGEALGVIWDGTGYGPDGGLWGGEFLLGDARGYRRVAHLRAFPLPGGEAAVREPRRVALALLWEAYGDAAFGWDDLAPVAAFTPAERRLLATMLERRVNAPPATGMGRLFDGVAAIAGLHQRANFEGQAAMALELAVDASERGAYPMDVRTAGDPILVDWAPMLEALVADIRRGVDAGVVAARFHNGLIEGLVTVARTVGEPRVALSGGCFQNAVLVEAAVRRLGEEGFQPILHRLVPANDGGLSLGQVAVAAAKLEAGKA